MAPSAEEYELRQMILDEWRANQTKPQALKNIRDKLGNAAVTTAKVNYWYTRFDKGDTSIFNKNSAIRTLFKGTSNASVSKNPVNSVLLAIDEKNLNSMLTLDGRLVIFPDHMIQRKRHIVFYDLFHGVSKKIPSPFGRYHVAGMIGDFLLMWENSNDVCISKIDYDTLTLGTPKQITLDAAFGDYAKPLVDQLDSSRFLILSGQKVVIGQIEGDEIVLNEVKNMPVQQRNLMGGRLMGSKLQGFIIQQHDDFSSMKFCEINLDTMQMKQMDSPIVLDTENEARHDLCEYSWSNSRCYAIDDYYKSQNKPEHRILSFDPQRCIWSSIQSLSKNPTTMFADSHDILTLHVPDENKKSIIFRFANKKPDSLKNLAWFAILRNSKLFGGDIYHQIAHLLPYNCDLRCLIPEENVEEP